MTKGKLINKKTRRVIKVGDVVMTFRGERAIVVGWYSKPAPSTGRVIIQEHACYGTQEFYPSVIGAKIV